MSGKARYSAEARRLWTDNRKDCLDISEAGCRIIARPIWLVVLCCMRDATGVEIWRHLMGCTEEFRLAVFDVCIRPEWGHLQRTWEDWRARRLAVICIFFAYLCQRSEYHGAVVWVVRGIPKGAIRVACRLSSMVDGKDHKRKPHRNTVLTDFYELQRAGILDWEQFDSWKVPKWGRGKVKTDANGKPLLDKKGRVIQWAFNYYFLLICPWPNGAECGRVIPVPRGAPIRRMTQNATPQIVIEKKKEEAAEEKKVAASVAADVDALERQWAAQEEEQRLAAPAARAARLEAMGAMSRTVLESLERSKRDAPTEERRGVGEKDFATAHEYFKSERGPPGRDT